MKVHCKHPSSAVAQLVEVVSVDREAKTAAIRSVDKMTQLALEKAGRTNETTNIPLAWVAWIPCGPTA